jgi:prevent-host-death family protein
MQQVNVTELRNHLHKYLENVQNGKEVQITWHGKIIARILPAIDKKKEALNQLRGLRHRCKMTDVVSPIDEDWEASN